MGTFIGLSEVPRNPDYDPGGNKARDAGCICPIYDNQRGKGVKLFSRRKPIHWVDLRCPIHSEDAVLVLAKMPATYVRTKPRRGKNLKE